MPEHMVDLCVYCGKRKATTRDHVPPRCLFPDPKPSNLITVPCCEQCNRGASKDDEYFRTMLAFRHDLPASPQIAQIREAALRSLSRPQAPGFRKALLDTVHEVELVTLEGLFVKRTLSYQPKVRRLEKVPARIVKALFYHGKGYRLPDDHIPHAYLTAAVGGPPELAVRLVNNVVKPLLSNAPLLLFRGIFACWGSSIETHPDASAWLLAFYERVFFLCFTGPGDAGGQGI